MINVNPVAKEKKRFKMDLLIFIAHHLAGISNMICVDEQILYCK